MRFEGCRRGVNRSDYEQFTKFLGINQPKYQKDSQIVQNGDTSDMTMQKYPLAMVYAVKQCFRGTYDPGVALSNGTVFEELNKPFYPIGCKNNGREGCL